MEKIVMFHDREDVETNIENGYYLVHNHMEYPKSISAMEMKHIEDSVKDGFRGTYTEIMAEIDKQQKKATRAYKTKIKKYNNLKEELLDELKSDLAAIFNVTGNDKLDMLFEKAERYSDTQMEILENFEYLVELIIPTRALKIEDILND
jgi:transcriptional regulator of heat shock response